MSPVAYGQRWRSGQHSWRHTHEGGFDPARYTMGELDETAARTFVETHHYSRAWPAARLRYGLNQGDQLVGVAVLGVPMSAAVLTGPFPTLEPYAESLELARLVLLDQVPANAESWFCARAFDLAASAGVRGLVAFSDPMPRQRTTAARVDMVMPGHVGTVYQALGATYTGTATPRTLLLLPDATVLTARAAAKVTGGEQGHLGVVDRLVALGAPTPAGQLPSEWLRIALAAVGARRVRHHGNHRYAFRIGTRAQRTRTAIALASHPYPKRGAR